MTSAVNDVIRVAIQREIDAYNLYANAAAQTDSPVAKDILGDLAAQEQGHRTRLERIVEGNTFERLSKIQRRKVEDLKITDYLVEVPLSPDSSLQDILIVAGKRERASFELYSALSRVAEDDETRELFEFLSSEELAHKNRVERLYDELVYQDN